MPAPPLDELFNVPAAFALPDGRTLALGDLTEEDRARFVRRLKDRAAGEYARLPEDTPPAALRAFAEAVTEGLAAGTYDWAGPACVRALAQPWGGIYALFLAGRRADPEYTEEQAEADWWAAVRAGAEALARQAVAKAAADPGN